MHFYQKSVRTDMKAILFWLFSQEKAGDFSTILSLFSTIVLDFLRLFKKAHSFLFLLYQTKNGFSLVSI